MTDIFMKIDDIPGDSKDAAHPDEIEVLSWHWRIAKFRPNDSSQLYGNGRKGVGGLEFVHRIDRATPKLMHFCLTGDRIVKATLSLRENDVRSHDFFILTMSNIVIDRLTPCSMDTEHYETVVLSFTMVKQEYIRKNERGNCAVVSSCYDMARQY